MLTEWGQRVIVALTDKSERGVTDQVECLNLLKIVRGYEKVTRDKTKIFSKTLGDDHSKVG